MTVLSPQPSIPSARWIEKNLNLPSETSDTPGSFDFHYVPGMEGILAALDDPQITDVYCMKSAQIAWTTILIGYLFSRIDQEPSPIIGMFSSEGAAREFSQEKWITFSRDCYALSGKLESSGKRQQGNNLLHRSFPGGFAKLVGSNAVRSLKSTSAPCVFAEEPDDSADNTQSQGDPLKILFERTKAYRYPKRILGGTPTIKNFSRVESRLELTDKCVLPIECNGCNEKHVLSFDNVSMLDSEPGSEPDEVFGKQLPATAVYVCPRCDICWDDAQRKKNIRDTVNNAKAAGDKFCGWVPTRQTDGSKKGFVGLGELYSCLPGAKMQTLGEKHLEAEYFAARGDETKRISFVNNQLGQAYEFSDGTKNAESLRERAANDPNGQHDQLTCPRGGLLVCVGIDVQHDRVAVRIDAYGPDEECWLMFWDELPAKDSCMNKNDPVWDALDSLIFQGFTHASGSKIFASAISIDSSDGGTSDAVYNWVRTRKAKQPRRRIMAIKGSSASTDPQIYTIPKSNNGPDHHNPDRLTKAQKHKLKIYSVGTNKAKDFISGQLQAEVIRLHCHRVDQLRHDYFDQMCGEVKLPHKTIRNRKTWQQKSGQPIEAWDCLVYSMHAARSLRVNTMTPAEWKALEISLLQEDLFKPLDQPVKIPENKNSLAEKNTRNNTNWRKSTWP